MKWNAALLLALTALWRNKTRAMLTTLGVIIGVASVIAMVSIGAGAQQRIADQLASMGTNTLVIRPGSITRGGVRTGAGTTTSLTRADAEAMRQLPGVIAVAPTVRSPVLDKPGRGHDWPRRGGRRGDVLSGLVDPVGFVDVCVERVPSTVSAQRR